MITSIQLSPQESLDASQPTSIKVSSASRQDYYGNHK
jgi:hypothetical protein